LKYHENSSLGLNLKNGALKPAPVCFVDSKEEYYVGFVPQKSAMVPNGTIILNNSRHLSSRAQAASCVRTHFANQNIEWKNGQVRDAVRCCAFLCDVIIATPQVRPALRIGTLAVSINGEGRAFHLLFGSLGNR
jgi:hypothetical protein